ncbi:hypothetical protein HID58_034068 [Brassica napus]|uniref:Uncharacterized protein n=1 Tax=Brassica napus TaxID=3708 RepID=A0ABQ8C1Z8_BRANA|nr:hypothetical protein HID58_034068 [Brassica napus]
MHIRTIELDTKRIKLQIWDTAGQEHFRTITAAYYRGAMGILLVYDVTDESSFNNIRNWIRNIEQHASDNVNKILVGNKADMDESKKGQALADEYGIKFFEAVSQTYLMKTYKTPLSAKTNLNVEEVFFLIAKDIKQRLTDTDSRAEDEKKCITGSFCDMLFISPLPNLFHDVLGTACSDGETRLPIFKPPMEGLEDILTNQVM